MNFWLIKLALFVVAGPSSKKRHLSLSMGLTNPYNGIILTWQLTTCQLGFSKKTRRTGMEEHVSATENICNN